MDTTVLEKLIADGRDSALLRLGLGDLYRKQGNLKLAIEHLRAAVAMDSGYSGAWKGLAKALAAAGKSVDAIAAYQKGIEAAQANGDKQAEREMRVFLKRLEGAQ